jgi:hypothetical protein
MRHTDSGATAEWRDTTHFPPHLEGSTLHSSKQLTSILFSHLRLQKKNWNARNSRPSILPNRFILKKK